MRMSYSAYKAWGETGKALLQRIEIKNFKAFKNLTLNLNGRHLLLYGANGSGKSSLYWALYTFLQSAGKTTDEIFKYFNKDGPQSLLNIYEDPEENTGKIEIAFGDGKSAKETIYRIGAELHETNDRPLILKGNLASDFITYRFFFGFSDFRNSEMFNIWSLFEKEILPFCVTHGGSSESLEEQWVKLHHANPNPNKYKGRAGGKAYRDFNVKLKQYSDTLKPVIATISDAAQKFYDKHFSDPESDKITLKIAIVLDAYYAREAKIIMPPVLEFGIKVNGNKIKKPQSFLNEAKMTQIALSIRFAASLVNLHQSPLKLLVLDDILVSLDMSNRMKVVEILLSETFADYQKIIMTHDRGLFNEVKRQIQNNEHWSFVTLTGNPQDGIKAKPERRPLEKAEDYFADGKLDEVAQHLRIAAEENVKTYRQVVLNQKVADGFTSLSDHIKAVKKHFEGKLLQRCKQAMSGCKSLNFTDEEREKAEVIQIFNKLQKMMERVLNPAAHWNEVPLYEKEVEKTLELIKKLASLLEGEGVEK